MAEQGVCRLNEPGRQFDRARGLRSRERFPGSARLEAVWVTCRDVEQIELASIVDEPIEPGLARVEPFDE